MKRLEHRKRPVSGGIHWSLQEPLASARGGTLHSGLREEEVRATLWLAEGWGPADDASWGRHGALPRPGLVLRAPAASSAPCQ